MPSKDAAPSRVELLRDRVATLKRDGADTAVVEQAIAELQVAIAERDRPRPVEAPRRRDDAGIAD